MNETMPRNRPLRAGRVRRKRLQRLAIAAAVVLLLIGGWCASLFVRIVTFDGVGAGTAAVRADAGIVLGASLRGGRPSPGLQERLDHALQLYRAGVFPRFIVSGGLDSGETITEAEGMRDYLVGQGVPPEAILLEPDSRSTYENLRFSKQVMERSGLRTAVIVTHSYHGARAADIAAYLDYAPVQVSVTESQVMSMAYHKTREVLAFAKWQADKVRRTFG